MTERDIPEQIKRTVRQRCGFGCIVCGNPIVHYHHIKPWHEVRAHTSENITLLCATHHQQATPTPALLPESEVARYDASPYNVVHGGTAPLALHYGMAPVDFYLGSNRISSSSPNLIVLEVFGDRLLWFSTEDGVVELGCRIFDDSGRLTLEIRRNEIVVNEGAWDVKFVGSSLHIWRGPGDPILELTFEPPRTIRIIRAAFHHHGVVMSVRDGDFISPGGTMSLTHVHGAVAFAFGRRCLWGYGAAWSQWPEMSLQAWTDKQERRPELI